MRLGMFMMSLHDPARDNHEVLMEDVEIATYCDELGYDEFWIGEHYTASSEPVPAPMIFLANLLGRTKRMKLGTGVVNLPQTHPAQVAAHIAYLDHISEGRLMFGIGPGGLGSDLEMFGETDPKARGEMMMESIDVILELWTKDAPFQFEGKYWNFKLTDMVLEEFGVGVTVKPYQTPHPPIAVPAMSPFSGTMKMAGQRGWIPISSNIIPTYSVASQWRKYVEGCEAEGRTADPEIWRVGRTIFVAESDQEAEAYVNAERNLFQYYYAHMHGLLSDGGILGIVTPDPKMDPTSFSRQDYCDDNLIYGSPDTVVEKLLAFREQVGHFGVLIAAALEYDDRARTRTSMALLANEVMPKLRAAIGTSSAAAQ